MSVCFVAAFPFRIFLFFLSQLTLSTQMRILQILCIGGSVLLHPRSMEKYPIMSLVVADVIVLPCFMILSGVVQGIVLSFSFPRGYLLSFENLVCLLWIVRDTLGSFLGPPIAMWAVDRGGRHQYATQQIVLTVVAV